MKQFKYVPVIQTKSGEFGALQRLTSRFWDMSIPLMAIPPIPKPFPSKEPAKQKSFKEHINNISDSLVKAWQPTNEMFLDVSGVGHERNINDIHVLTKLVDDFSEYGVFIIPVIHIEDTDADIAAAIDTTKRVRHGIALRLDCVKAYPGQDINNSIGTLLSNIDISPSSFVLILDFNHIQPETADYLTDGILKFILDIPYAHEWRNIVILATAFPKSLGGMASGSTSIINRGEWKLYNNLLQSRQTPNIIFGDYTTVGAGFFELDEPVQPAAKIKYTGEDVWYISKGTKYVDDPKQYHSMASSLMNHRIYFGSSHCWGDSEIARIGTDLSSGPGNLTTWTSISINHHISVVCDQLSNPPEL